MKTVTVTAHKGGVGKTTLTALLAHKASQDGHRVYLVDLDPQGSLSDWWSARPDDDPLHLISGDKDQLKQIKNSLFDKADYLFIDTPPAHQEIITAGIEVADFVFVPCRPSPLDVKAVGETLATIEAKKKPFAFVVNATVARTKISEQALMLLSQHGKIAPSAIRQRTLYASAMTSGGTALDYSNKDVQAEIGELYQYLIDQLEKTS